MEDLYEQSKIHIIIKFFYTNNNNTGQTQLTLKFLYFFGGHFDVTIRSHKSGSCQDGSETGRDILILIMLLLYLKVQYVQHKMPMDHLFLLCLFHNSSWQ